MAFDEIVCREPDPVEDRQPEPAGQASPVWRGVAWVSVSLLARISLVVFVPAQPGPLLSLDHVPKCAHLRTSKWLSLLVLL